VKVPKQKQKNTSTPCFVPEKARWDNLKTLHHDIGAELNQATEGIAEENPVIDRVLTHYRLQYQGHDLSLQQIPSEK